MGYLNLRREPNPVHSRPKPSNIIPRHLAPAASILCQTASMSAAPKPEVASGQHTDTTTKKTKIDSNSSSLCALSESAESKTGPTPEGRGGAGMAQVEEEKQQHASLEHKGTADAVAHLVGMGKGGKRTQVDTQSNSGTHKDGRPLRVGQLVEHKSLGFRGVVLGHTRVCAAPSSWMEHHRIDELPRGREQYFYHIIPDTRDVSLHPPPCHTEVAKSETLHSQLPAPYFLHPWRPETGGRRVT